MNLIKHKRYGSNLKTLLQNKLPYARPRGVESDLAGEHTNGRCLAR
jgi:hypothetical protein